MFSFRSLGFGLPNRLFSSLTQSKSGIDIPSVTIHGVEENSDKRARTLKHLLKANHINHSIIYNDLRFHNHAPHILGSAYILGASPTQLHTIYDEESRNLESWQDSPGEISAEDWRNFLGKRNYQRAYIDFFEDQLVGHGYDWKALLDEFLFEGHAPLVNCLIGGLAHPLIHLGYAYELDSQTVAIEALGLTACFYDGLHKYLDDPQYTKPAPEPSTDLLDLLDRVRKDKRFDGSKTAEDSEALDTMWRDGEKEAALVEFWNSWDLSDPQKQFADSQKAATALLVGSAGGKNSGYDFFLCHVLTSSHAVRILLSLFPDKWHVPLVRQWWLFALSAYTMQNRPAIDVSRIEGYDLKGRDWKYVDDRALNSKWATDAHFVKACRAMKVSAETWGDQDSFYLKAAVRFAEEFNDWSG